MSYKLSLQTPSRALNTIIMFSEERLEQKEILSDGGNEGTMFLVEARKKLKQKEVGCSIWQSMQSRRLLQQ